MPIQSASGVVMSFRREQAFGQLATNDSTARSVPYVSSGIALSKSTISSEEQRPDFQVATMRHGNRAVSGDLSLQLQCNTYSPLMESALRRDFSALAALAPLTNVTAASVAQGGTFTRAAGSWIADGLTVGMVIRMTGWTTTAVANNNRNYTIAALTATQITVVEPVAAKAAGDSIVVSVPGRFTFAPTSGHTQTSYTIEEWNPDVPRSHRFVGCRVNTMNVSCPPNARAELQFGFMGRDRLANAARHFANASVPAGQAMQVGHNGILVVNGVLIGVLTSFTMNMSNNMEVGAVVGSALTPDVFHGRMTVEGSVSCYFDTTTFDDIFDLESEVGLVVRVTDDLTPNSQFIQIALPRIKLSGGSYGTQNQSRVQSFNYTALIHPGTAGNPNTSIFIQDGSLI